MGDPAYVYRVTHRTSVFSSVFKRIWFISVAWARDSPLGLEMGPYFLKWAAKSTLR